MSNRGFMMDARRFTKTALDVHGKLNIRLHQPADQNDTWVGYIEDPRRASDDDIGALYYVVAVIFIYGLSIVMMIASHIRKNKQDNQLRTYLKEMAKLRKDDRREQVLSKMTDLANRRQLQETKQKMQEKLKDTAVDSETEGEVCRPLMKKEGNEDNSDSVFLPPDYCIPPGLQKSPQLGGDRQSENSFYRNASVSSKTSLRNNSIGSNACSNVPSDCQSPSLSDFRFYTERAGPGRVRSPSFQDYRKWRRPETRSCSVQDYRAVRIHERPSPSLSDQRSILSPPESRSPSLNEFRLSPLCKRERASTIHEVRSSKWSKPKTLSPSDVKLHRLTDTKQPAKFNDVKLNLPANFHIVDEDDVL